MVALLDMVHSDPRWLAEVGVCRGALTGLMATTTVMVQAYVSWQLLWFWQILQICTHMLVAGAEYGPA